MLWVFFWDKSITISWGFVAIITGIYCVLLYNGDFRRWNPKIVAFYADISINNINFIFLAN